ncbi:MAG: arginine repressor [Clostridiales bacterium]|jgi:transcriptional regulator of arginine metabolism|nr:arginine repressor [Clostridiales bacterium]
MNRNIRQSKILDLIEKNEIETQEDLGAHLQRVGLVVTQATISRDIKELGLVKTAGKDKKYKYSAPVQHDSGVSGKMINLFRAALINMDSAGNIIVLKTLIGSANAAGNLVDKLGVADVLGCVAGDDTVIVVTRGEAAAGKVMSRLRELL